MKNFLIVVLLFCFWTETICINNTINNQFLEGITLTYRSPIKGGFVKYPIAFLSSQNDVGSFDIDMIQVETYDRVSALPSDIAITSQEQIVFGLVPTQKEIEEYELFENFTIVGLTSNSRGALAKYEIIYEVVERIVVHQNITEEVINGTLVSVDNGSYNSSETVFNPKITAIAKADQLLTLKDGIADYSNGVVYCVSAQSPPMVYKIETTNMTVQGNFEVGSDDFVLSIHIDVARQKLYLLGASSLVKIDLLEFDNSNATVLSLSYISGGILTGVVDVRNNIALVTGNSSPTFISKIDLEGSMTPDMAWRLDLNGFTTSRTSTIDPIGGSAYFVSFNTIGRVARVNLRTLTISETFRFNNASRIVSSIVDKEGNGMYLISKTSVTQLLYPASCKNDCSGRGVCDFGVCQCDPAWDGIDCTSVGCARVNNVSCNGKGFCDNGVCGCIPGWTGSLCNIETCPKDCSGNGDCDLNTHICTCEQGYSGEDCATVLPYLPCDEAESINTCTKNPGCVWCESEKDCLHGTIEGPSSDFCFDWHYRDRRRIELIIVDAIFIAIASLLLIVNMYSAFREDIGGEEAVKGATNNRMSWWRSQRSAKGWAIIEQFQFVALTGLIGYNFPSGYLTFTRYFNWTLLAFGLPWKDFDSKNFYIERENVRQLFNIEQHSVTTGANPYELFLGTLLMFAILLVALLLVRVALLAVKKKIFHWRWTYALGRFLMFSQMGMLVAAAYTLVKAKNLEGGDWVGFALAIIVLICFGLVMPIGSFVYFFFLDKKQIFNLEHRKKFGVFYESFSYNRCWFIGLVLAKRALIAMFIGFLDVSGIASTVVALVSLIAYVAAVIVLRPFLDVISNIVEIVIVIIDIIMFALMFVFTKENDTPIAITYLVFALQIAAWVVLVVSYLFLWTRMKNYQSLRQLFSGLLKK